MIHVEQVTMGVAGIGEYSRSSVVAGHKSNKVKAR